MAGAAVWRGARVVGVLEETARVRTIVLEVPGWPGHSAGQHVDLRLTAEDGYQTERSYSIASAPEDARLALTVERIDGGEVSAYLTRELGVGDELELRGPLGGYFTWRTRDGGPLLLIAHGPGVVPLMAMLRHRAANASTVDARLLVSSRSPAHVFHRDELAILAKGAGLVVHHTFTDPSAGGRPARAVDAQALRTVGPAPTRHPRIFVSGPTGFVGRTADLLVELGHERTTIRVQDFGAIAA